MTRRRTTQAGTINWQQARQRLSRAQRATEAALRLSPERAREVMEERARALAAVPATAPNAAEVLPVVTFVLVNERYALEAVHIREVVRLIDFTPLPGAPPFLRGVINLRGEILAIIDLRTFFGLPNKGLSDLSRVLVLGGDRAEFGVQADEVEEVRVLCTDEVLEPPGSVAGIGREYLRGVTREALIVLDGTALLQDSRLFVDQKDAGG